jgi:hypothetical protein
MLTLARIKEIEKILEKADKEIDAIIQAYYMVPGGQNVAGGIGRISRMHAELVEQLAQRKRELLAAKKGAKR